MVTGIRRGIITSRRANGTVSPLDDGTGAGVRSWGLLLLVGRRRAEPSLARLIRRARRAVRNPGRVRDRDTEANAARQEYGEDEGGEEVESAESHSVTA